MNPENYSEQFSIEFQKAGESEWASSQTTDPEFGVIFGLYAHARRILKEDGLSGQELRQRAREEVNTLVATKGLTQPEEVSPKLLAQAGIAHGCVVAEHLAKVRGPEGAASTYWSYTTKSRIDRRIRDELIKQGKLTHGSGMHNEWTGSQPKAEGHHNEAVHEPESIDPTHIHGVSKPHRFLPANLIKNIIGVRDGMLSDDELQGLGVEEGSQSLYTVSDNLIVEAVAESSTVDDVANNIAVLTMKQLLENGLSDDVVLAFVLKSYGPKGPLFEHGDIGNTQDLMHDLLAKVHDEKESGLNRFENDLMRGIEEQYESLGYTFYDF